MRILKFLEEYNNESKCKQHFKNMREKEGVYCKKCLSNKHYWLSSKQQWQCSVCSFRTTLRSGTVMENSKLPFQYWFIAMAFMSFTKKGLSACELQRQLNHKRYESIWFLMQRIRKAMGQRDNLYVLNDMLEFDEAYIEKSTSKKVVLKRGKGSQKQKNVAVMAESVPLENIETGVVSKQCRYFKMKVLANHTAGAINKTIAENIENKSIIFSDKSKSYVDIEKFVEAHLMEKSNNETTTTTLKWVHIAISNVKRNLLGIYYKIKGKYLQLYLDEFCYKLNRRYFGDTLFDRLVVATAKSYWYQNG